MADYGPAQLFLYSIPPGKEADAWTAVTAWFDEYDWSERVEHWDVDDEGIGTLRLPGPYTDEQARLSIAPELGEELAQIGCAFDLWQDPKYEFPGEVYMHVPEVGTWTGPCDAQGEPYLEARQIDQLVEEWRQQANPTGESLVKMFDDATGGKVRRSIDRMHAIAQRAVS